MFAAAIPAGAETLADAIALAYRENPSIQGSRYDLRAADENVVQALADLRPTASLSVTGGYARTVSGQSGALDSALPRASGANSNQTLVSVDQPLYTGGRATADRTVAEAGVLAQREVLRGTEGDLLLAVISAYADLLRYQTEMKVWTDSIAELERLDREIAARCKAGQFTRTDIAQADSQLAVTRARTATTELALEAARASYAALVGHEADTLAPLPALPQVPADVQAAYDDAERQSPELAQARDVELGSRGEVLQARAAGRPTVTLRGSAELSGTAYPYRLQNQDRDLAGSVVLSVPISAGGRTASQIRQALDRNTGDRIRIEAARREMVHTVRDAWNQMVIAQRTVDLFDSQSAAAATQLEGSIAEYRVGLRSTFDLLYAQQSLRDARLSALDARRDGYVATASLLRRAGLLEVRALLTSVPLYDPADHLRHVAKRNAVPWEALVAAIDQVGAPPTGQRTIRQPARPLRAPAIADHAGSAAPTDAPLARSGPIDPVPGTVGTPVSPSDRKSSR